MAQVKPKAPAAKAPTKPEDLWSEARLIPTTGIGGQADQEQRATSALLAVLRAVPEFGRAVLAPTGAPAGRIRTYIEVQFPDDTGKTDKIPRPDGAVIVEWGKKRWVALLEVKTGGAPLVADQINAYLDIAHARGYDAVITISNQITSSPEESPVKAKHWKAVALRHISWWRILTEARVEHARHAVSDPDQAWILDELIRYLESGRAGTGGFDDMGDRWVAVRDAAHQKTLRLADAGVADIASRWEQLIDFIALEFTKDLRRRVVPAWPKDLDVAARLDRNARSLVETGQLHASLRVPDAAGPLDIEADLRARQVFTSVVLDAPQEGKPKTRLGWLLRQLADAPDDLGIEVHYPNVRDPERSFLRDVRTKPERLLLVADPGREPRSFRLLLCRDLGMKRGGASGSFVSETQRQATDFYRLVVQTLRPWRAPAPTLPPPEPGAAELVTGAATAESEASTVGDAEAQGVTTPAPATGPS
jgi:hypothetical protein